MRRVVYYLILGTILLLSGCSGASIEPGPAPTVPGVKPTPDVTRPTPPTDQRDLKPTVTPETTSPLEIQKVLNLGIMVHLEGWEDGVSEDKFRLHADLLREYATLFEKYGAKLTLESKEMTDGAIQWHDNVLLEVENRGHGIGVHADVGGSMKDTLPKMKLDLTRMKSRLESLGVKVRHVSGVNSHCDWVKATTDAGFEFVTGVVSYALLSLPEEKRPIVIPDGARPGEFHQAYPFNLEDRLHAWRAEKGSNWINDNPNGNLVIIPSGEGLAFSYEESQGSVELGGNQNLTVEDIDAFEQELNTILEYIKSDKSTQPYTYYLSWSFGKALDKKLIEQWLQMVDKYVVAGKVQWKTIPEMYDDYIKWEIDTGRR